MTRELKSQKAFQVIYFDLISFSLWNLPSKKISKVTKKLDLNSNTAALNTIELNELTIFT